MKNTTNKGANSINENHNNYVENMQEMEIMRSELKKLKSIIAGQQIINERMMRQAMGSGLSKERKEIRFSIIMAVSAMLVNIIVLPKVEIPIWFIISTNIFLIVAIFASVYSLRKYMHINIASDNLLNAAEKIIAYKKFTIDWLKFSIPVLLIWIFLFFYILSSMINGKEITGMFYGGLIGLVIGTACGLKQIYNSRKRMNTILNQIKELKEENS